MQSRQSVRLRPSGSASSRNRVARAVRSVIAAGSVTLATACYDLRPTMQIEPKQDVEYRIELTDAARVAVADQLGPEVREVTGHVVRRDGDDVTIAVSEVVYLKGDNHRMTGEQVHFNRQQLSSVNERTLSLTKSLILAGAIALAVGVFVGSRSLFGAGGSQGDGHCSGPGCGSASSLHP